MLNVYLSQDKMAYLFIFIFGAVIGSFLNVCIYRIPRNESIAFSRSRCVHCKKTIAWYDNVPFLSYMFLRGKCRSCKGKISPRYFIVELISVLALLTLFVYFGFSAKFWVYSLLSFVLIAITFIDFEFQIIPDRFSVGGLFFGILISVLVPSLHFALTWKTSIINSLLGAFVGAALMYLTGFLGSLAFKKESMGGGDVKLMAMLGAFLGWKMAVLIFFLAPFFGSPAGIYLKFRKKQDIIPYGPYIAMASFVAMIWGHDILKWIIGR